MKWRKSGNDFEGITEGRDDQDGMEHKEDWMDGYLHGTWFSHLSFYSLVELHFYRRRWSEAFLFLTCICTISRRKLYSQKCLILAKLAISMNSVTRSLNIPCSWSFFLLVFVNLLNIRKFPVCYFENAATSFKFESPEKCPLIIGRSVDYRKISGLLENFSIIQENPLVN